MFLIKSKVFVVTVSNIRNSQLIYKLKKKKKTLKTSWLGAYTYEAIEPIANFNCVPISAMSKLKY